MGTSYDDVTVYSPLQLFPTRGFFVLRREYMRDLEESCQHSHGKNKKKNKKKKKRATSSSSESEDRKSRARRKNRRSGADTSSYLLPVSRIHYILGWIRIRIRLLIRGSMPLIFVVELLKMATKN